MFGRYGALRRYLADTQGMPPDARMVYHHTSGRILGSRLLTGCGTFTEALFTDDEWVYAVVGLRPPGLRARPLNRYGFGPKNENGPFGCKETHMNLAGPCGSVLKRLRAGHTTFFPYV